MRKKMRKKIKENSFSIVYKSLNPYFRWAIQLFQLYSGLCIMGLSRKGRLLETILKVKVTIEFIYGFPW